MLGLKWIAASDLLGIAKPSIDDQPKVWTKRSLLKHLAAFFDSLGIASPLLLSGKILLQDAWKATVGWDEDLPEQLAKEISEWWGAALRIPEVTIPRWLSTQLHQPVQLHVFSDASEKALGCCVYVVTDSLSHLVYSKTKVAPINVGDVGSSGAARGTAWSACSEVCGRPAAVACVRSSCLD